MQHFHTCKSRFVFAGTWIQFYKAGLTGTSRAQGAAQAIEDAATLGVLMKGVTKRSQVPGILDKFQEIRKPRTGYVRMRSRKMREINGMPDGPHQQERDRRMRDGTPCDGFPIPWADPVLQDFLFGYDVTEEVTSA